MAQHRSGGKSGVNLSRVTASWVVVVLCAAGGHAQTSLEQLEQQAFQQAVAVADPSIVRIETVGGLDLVGDLLTATGPTTGVVVREDGYIITSSFNFASQPASVLVTLPDERRFAAEVVAQDMSKMLTLLKIESDGLVPLQPLAKDDVRVGQWSLALGRTFDLKFPNISIGIVSAKNRIWGRAIQADAKISPVNYGGPLVDLYGRGIGILVPLSPQERERTAGVEWYDSGIGFAIPLEDVLAVLDRLIAGETLKPGLMGVSFEDLGQLSGAAKVVRVRPTSPADEAGIIPDDIIEALEDVPIAKVNDLKHVLGTRYAGEQLTVRVKRGEDSFDTTLTLTDELKAYQFPSLGVLPDRADDPLTPGVGLRHILPESGAAHAGLKPGDRITHVDGEEVLSASDLARRLSQFEPEATLELTRTREGTPETVTLTLDPFPDARPHDLPEVSIALPGNPPTETVGRFNQQLPGDDRQFWVYVPEGYNPQSRYGVLLWAHPPGDTMEAEVLRGWKDHANERGLVLAGPRAGELSGWAPDEEDYVRSVVDWIREHYAIDPARIAVVGSGSSGAFAMGLAFKYRELIRGVIAIDSPLRSPPPDNDPDTRLLIAMVSGETSVRAPDVAQSVELLRARFFPTEHLIRPAGEEEVFSADVLNALAVWLDALDRL